ncbi:Uncharacterised protein [Ralstonia mannitolilytica]|uniref:Uncharacterized protein n=1 Tax=Ralstonia mannitolilytica TaxID=105219 RepID=A0AAJ4ZQ10_9RALS|nr:hypothetical protein LMG6866_00918 [Ralstonia mannitolilytica]SUE26141.1 Uncharacterised protein [Ralstonia mannitolilytica]SUE35952.1 Uncharacterised protein [Ralstonia mannitolilytica]
MPETQGALRLLRSKVIEDMERYLAEYRLPPAGSTAGNPWSVSKVERELSKMRDLLVEPYPTKYECDDTLIPVHQRLSKGRRRAYVVAEDGSYRLAFDADAGDFVLISLASNGSWYSWGIRGDASGSFLAR